MFPGSDRAYARPAWCSLLCPLHRQKCQGRLHECAARLARVPAQAGPREAWSPHVSGPNSFSTVSDLCAQQATELRARQTHTGLLGAVQAAHKAREASLTATRAKLGSRSAPWSCALEGQDRMQSSSHRGGSSRATLAAGPVL